MKTAIRNTVVGTGAVAVALASVVSLAAISIPLLLPQSLPHNRVESALVVLLLPVWPLSASSASFCP
ncbi:hypothetical protein [Pseudomonas huanghezhanensis]|uniref:hypothetical protein n=1 Tax=Pseudomonas huanghezhanensis TaxID=3002903 RepID=UPI002286068E|nr:hypothetical protein [Pseudomonas sp. BSw22131]